MKKLTKKSDEKQSINKVALYFMRTGLCSNRKQAFKKSKEAINFHFDFN